MPYKDPEVAKVKAREGRIRRRADPEHQARALEQQRLWRADHPGRVREQHKKAWVKDKAKLTQRHRAFCQSEHGRTVMNAKARRWRAENPDYCAALDARKTLARSMGVKRADVPDDLVAAQAARYLLLRRIKGA